MRQTIFTKQLLSIDSSNYCANFSAVMGETQYFGCLYPGCELHHAARGLCRKHYLNASRLVRKNKTTWERLEADNKARPLPVNWFLEK